MLDNVRVVEAAEDFYFALDLFKDALQLDFALVQNFDGNLVICDLVNSHYRRKTL